MYYVLCTIWLLLNSLVSYLFLPHINLDIISEGVLYSTNPGKGGSSSPSGLNVASNGAIMATSVAAGSKLAQTIPSIAGKIAALVASIGLGVGAIAAKDIAGNITENIGKSTNKLLPSYSSNSKSIAGDLFDLSGDSIKDLLILIQTFEKFEIVFLYLILYYLILLLLKVESIEEYLLKVFPQYIVSKLISPIKLFKKNGPYIILIFIILSLISAHLLIHYLDPYFIIYD